MKMTSFPGRLTPSLNLTAIIITTTMAALSPCVAIAASPASPDSAEQFEVVKRNVAEAFHLENCDLQQLSIPVAVRAPLNVTVSIDGRPVQLKLAPVSNRAESFAVFAARDGQLQRFDAPAPRTYRGTIEGRHDTGVAATISNGELHAVIIENNELWSVQPASRQARVVDRSWHVIYKGADVLPGPWTCGADADGLPQPRPQLQPARGFSTSCTSVAELAIDADHEYYVLNNSSLADTVMDIETIINEVNLLYGFQVGINHAITDIVVQTTLADPFTQTSPGAVLDEFTTYRNGVPYPTNPMPDVAHLFTGKEIAGSVIGVAWLNAVCNDNFHYGFSQSQFTDNLLLRTILTAHELGHNWSARHCDGDFDCGIMCSAVASCDGQNNRFGIRSTTDIVSFRDSIGCLEAGSSIIEAGGTLMIEDPKDANQNDNFGTSVDIGANIAVIGAYADDEAGENAGAAYVLKFDGGAWTQVAKLMPELDPSPAGDRFGISVAVDSSNPIPSVAVGAYFDTGTANISGSVSIFIEDPEKGWLQTQKLTRPPMKVAGDLFGYDIAISGPYMIVGAPRADNKKGKDSGAAFIYQRGPENTWEFMQMITEGKSFGDANDQYGTAVAIDWDPIQGGTAVVGAWMNDEQASGGGALFIYRNALGIGTWQFQDAWYGKVAGNQFGYSVAVSGNTVVAGIWLDDTIAQNAGAVTIIPLAGGAQPVLLTEPDLEANDRYGSAVAIDGDLMAVGAYISDATILNGGAVYGYRRVNGVWTPIGQFVPDDLGNGDQMGLSLAISGDLIITGAWMHDDVQSNQGAAHIFVAEPEPTDCNANGVPDSCDFEFGTEFDCNTNGVPDSCDIINGQATDVDMNGIPDSCDTDCNNNGITDTTEIADGAVPDCNENNFPDSCDVDPGDPDGDGNVSADINNDGVPDECSPDCNNNGIPDSIDVATMTSPDCNANGVPDECDISVFSVTTGQLGPIGAGSQQTLILNDTTTPPPWASSDIQVRVFANADLDLSNEYITLFVDGGAVFELFRSGAVECPIDGGVSPDVETRSIPAALWNAALRTDDEVIVRLQPSSSMDATQCPDGSWVTISISYLAGDCNNNGVLDACETADGLVPDCNDNGVPDSCEIVDFDANANGIPDDCETCIEDFNADGNVNVTDLFTLLADWGPCAGCPTDIASASGFIPDGVVNVYDLFRLLSAWNSACP